EVRHNFVGWSCGHHDVVGGNRGIRRVLREGSLIQAIGHGWGRSKVVFVPVVSADGGMGLAPSDFRRHDQCDTTFEKVSALHASLPSSGGALGGPPANQVALRLTCRK